MANETPDRFLKAHPDEFITFAQIRRAAEESGWDILQWFDEQTLTQKGYGRGSLRHDSRHRWLIADFLKFVRGRYAGTESEKVVALEKALGKKSSTAPLILPVVSPAAKRQRI